ncbi:MAG: type II/IV secretion system ATPase subunit [Candidatus Micrarchaeia archaeon]
MQWIKTKIDELCFFLEEQDDMSSSLPQAAKFIALDNAQVEKIAQVLSARDVLSIEYPGAMSPSPILRLKSKVEPIEKAAYSGKVLEEYSANTGNLGATIEIVEPKGEFSLCYSLSYPSPMPYTLAYLEQVRDSLAKTVPVSNEDITDPVKSQALYSRFGTAASKLLVEIPRLKDEPKKQLVTYLLNMMYGLGEIEFLLADDYLEEIAINGSGSPISVYHKKWGWLKTNIMPGSESRIYNVAAQIGRRSGRTITVLSPVMDAHLQTGDRVSATMFPISTCGHTLTIRKFSREPWSIVDFIDPKLGTISSEMAAFLWQAVQYELNVLVAGGTAAGKTSMLNTLANFIPTNSRTITIEDTRELSLPKHLKWNWVPLTTRNPNAEGAGGVRMLDLLATSLRMRPDRIILGEVRKRREAEVLFEAMHTGHAVYATIHADNSTQIIRRLTNPPFALPAMEVQSLHLAVVQYRDRATGKRRTYEISEVMSGAENTVSLNTVYRWRPRLDKFEKYGESTRVFEELALHTGMTSAELAKDISAKKDILEWMVDRNVRSVDMVGEVVSRYYDSPEELHKSISKNATVAKVLGR